MTAPSAGHLLDLLRQAREVGASDLHLSVNRPIFLRINGDLRFAAEPLSAAETETLIFEALEPEPAARLRERLSLDCCLVDGEDGRYRACFVHQRLGWDGAFRVIGADVPSWDALGLPESVAHLTDHHQGLVLVGGPGGAGKTTTLAALLSLINETRHDHILTIEDPIEYILESKRCKVTQRQRGDHTRSFAAALRAALREDPDVIMVGELRDLETTAMAITAAETGHLVLSTIHTRSAERTISSIVDAFPADQQSQVQAMLADSLRGIVCQQLVPAADGRTRHLALEILIPDAGISNIIRDNKLELLASEMQTGAKQGMKVMDDSLHALLQAGKIARAEAARRARDKKRFS